MKFTPGPEEYSMPVRGTLGFTNIGFCYEPGSQKLTAAVGDAEGFEVTSVFDNGLFLALRCHLPGSGTPRHGSKNEAVHLDRDRTKPFCSTGIVVSAGDVPTPPPSRLSGAPEAMESTPWPPIAACFASPVRPCQVVAHSRRLWRFLMEESRLLLMSMGELRVLRGRSRGDFTLRHARAGALLSGSSAYEDGSLMWHLDAFDASLASLLLPLPHSGEWVPVGLYDPVTFEVAVGRLPSTSAFSDGAALDFDVPLLPALLEGSDADSRLQLPGRTLPLLQPSRERASALAPRSSGLRPLPHG